MLERLPQESWAVSAPRAGGNHDSAGPYDFAVLVEKSSRGEIVFAIDRDGGEFYVRAAQSTAGPR